MFLYKNNILIQYFLELHTHHLIFLNNISNMVNYFLLNQELGGGGVVLGPLNNTVFESMLPEEVLFS